MSWIDWLVLIITLLGTLVYGIWKSRGQRNIGDYFLNSGPLPWYIILFSIMATQASAITFLSAPGQAYTDGMRFVQYYFGLPLAMVVLCVTFLPLFHRLKVFTAYEFLETRFDQKTRTLTTILFLLQRGVSTGISVYAPSIILSALLGWNIYWTNIFMGGILIIYTVMGGTKAVAYTQKLQLLIIFAGMFLAGWIVVRLLPPGVSFTDALHVSGKMGKLNVIVTKINITQKSWWQDKYNIWSGTIGGFFLALSYFGTDQSQVGRYLTGRSLKESRIGLLMNGIVKVPMQFLILLIGALLFVFYRFYSAPVFFNDNALAKVYQTSYSGDMHQLSHQYRLLDSVQKKEVYALVNALHRRDPAAEAGAQSVLKLTQVRAALVRQQAVGLIKKADSGADTDDTNYIFLHFVRDYLPKGLVGLLIAVIFLATWGSTSATLNSLASATMIDIHMRFFKKNGSPGYNLKASKWWTLFWGMFCIGVAQFAQGLGSLIQAVNILGSLFYGTMLGIFLVAFYGKKIGGTAVFWSAILSELMVIGIYRANLVSFLWLNAAGCLLVIGIAWTFHMGRRLVRYNQ
ncbi:MAG TPA: sodium:solute symporter [Chitinophagaceae bacterium]|nr:sodium:solute symporter [Chitinophagaceae bacterium]